MMQVNVGDEMLGVIVRMQTESMKFLDSLTGTSASFHSPLNLIPDRKIFAKALYVAVVVLALTLTESISPEGIML